MSLTITESSDGFAEIGTIRNGVLGSMCREIEADPIVSTKG